MLRTVSGETLNIRLRMVGTNLHLKQDRGEHSLVKRALSLPSTLLISLWFALNVADTLLSFHLIGQGGRELWFVHRVAGNMLWTTVIKYIVVVITVLGLAWIGRLRWLIWFILPMTVLVAWLLFDWLWLLL